MPSPRICACPAPAASAWFADFWLGLQAQFDIETAQDGMSEDIAAIKPRNVA